MLLIATSDKGGTGRSVTSSNVVYRRALLGYNVAYADFDFGSPTAGAVFGISGLARGTRSGKGTHSFLRGRASDYEECDVWGASDRASLRLKPPGCGRLVLIPGDIGGGEFASTADIVARCVVLFQRLQEEFDITVVDLSAGRSYAAEIVLAATASPELKSARCRWLVFHRWTEQHIIAAHGLVRGEHGLLEVAKLNGRKDQDFLDVVRYVRTAVVDPGSPDVAGLRPSQLVWLQQKNRELQSMAAGLKLGRAASIGTVPLDPVLQWQEQLITDDDVWARHVANQETVESFEQLAKAIGDDESWEPM